MFSHRLHITVNAEDPNTRGRQRGEQLKGVLADSYGSYLELFQATGRSVAQVRDDASRALETITQWNGRYAEEIVGVASGAGLEPWQIASLNARTEILAAGSTAAANECSTIAKRVAAGDRVRMFSVQTWDWHIELDPFWHTQQVSGNGYRFVGLSEAGILGKIGMNSAGLGLHFNILGHADDGVGGVPVHVLAAAVIEQCSTVEEAIEFVRDTPVKSSSAFTLIDEQTAVSLELSPAGVFTVPLHDGRVVRTNHFLTPKPQQHEKTALYQPDSLDRTTLIESRFVRYPEPQAATELLEFLYSDEGQAPLCAVPDMTLPYGERWATLATVMFSPEHRTALVAEGSPIDARTGKWLTLYATSNG